MRNGTPRLSSLKRSLRTLETIIADEGSRSVSALARDLQIPVATAHRQVASLVSEGYLSRSNQGRFVAGPRLMALLYRLDEKQVIVNAAAPVLHELATRVNTVVQLGTLENDMVTYRIKTGHGASQLFTKVGMQLEAYCSGMGKVLLANLPPSGRRDYLAGGPFIALTSRTITDPEVLAQELARVRGEGFAADRGEIAEGLVCVAVPIRNPNGEVPAAISVSQLEAVPPVIDEEALLAMLRDAARDIEARAFG